jgi:hypothetical protein
MTAAAVADVMAAPPTLGGTMRALLGWHDLVEARLSRGLLRWIAHHPYVLARRRGSASLL